MPFETFEQKGKHTVRTATPKVTIQNSRNLYISPTALELIGGPKRVDLLFDADKCRVALKPAPKGRYLIGRNERRSGTISFSAFMHHNSIRFDTAVSFHPYVEDGVLVFDLSNPL